MTTLKTKKGSILPLVNLKGKEYLMVAYRLQWLSEDVNRYDIETATVVKTDTSATVMATIRIYDDEGKQLRLATARKTESSKDFPDFEEKAETGSIGRALAMLGFGTQHALADLEEGTRIVDSPLQNTKSMTVENAKAHNLQTKLAPPVQPRTQNPAYQPRSTQIVQPRANTAARGPVQGFSPPREVSGDPDRRPPQSSFSESFDAGTPDPRDK